MRVLPSNVKHRLLWVVTVGTVTVGVIGIGRLIATTPGPPFEGAATTYGGASAVWKQIGPDNFLVSAKRQNGTWSPAFESNGSDLAMFR